jgi:hypothetical protein
MYYCPNCGGGLHCTCFSPETLQRKRAEKAEERVAELERLLADQKHET